MHEFSNLKGYDYYTDEGTGRLMAIRRSTGEIKEAKTISVPIGSSVKTPEQLEAIERRKEQERRRMYRKSTSEELRDFYFVHRERFDKLSAATVARLVYLSSFIRYDSDRLMITQRTQMKRENLPEVLGLSESTVRRFMEEVCPQFLAEGDDGQLSVVDKTFVKGNVGKGKKCTHYQRAFIEGVRNLYRSTPKNNHKQLGYLFKLLPFINTEFNMICWNPQETELDRIELMSIADFCELIGYDVNHLNTLVNIYKSIRFDVNGKQERFCSITYDGVNREDAKIFVNPHVLYGGADYRRVEVLGVFCD